jgi:hypothetical protein
VPCILLSHSRAEVQFGPASTSDPGPLFHHLVDSSGGSI